MNNKSWQSPVRSWPQWAMARVECANCGKHIYSETPAPHRSNVSYEPWLYKLWPQASTLDSRFGFMVFDKPQCRRVWIFTRAKTERIQHDQLDKHRRLMEDKLLNSGAV